MNQIRRKSRASPHDTLVTVQEPLAQEVTTNKGACRLRIRDPRGRWSGEAFEAALEQQSVTRDLIAEFEKAQSCKGEWKWLLEDWWGASTFGIGAHNQGIPFPLTTRFVLQGPP